MKLLLTDEAGKRVEVQVTSIDSFNDIVKKLSSEHGMDIDLQGLATLPRPIYPDMNVIKYFSSAASCDIAKSCEEASRSSFQTQGALEQDEDKQQGCAGSPDEICRLCAIKVTQSQLSSIDELIEKIHESLPMMQVELNDGLSQKMCSNCVLQLETVNLFVKQCIKADEMQRLNNVIIARKSASLPLTPIISKDKNQYQCNTCRKSFRSRSRLSFHVKLHETGKNAGCCPTCGKEFPSEACLFKHFVYNHSKQQTCLCYHCGRLFPTRGSLTYHERMHTGVNAMRPFTCDICSRSFARKNILRDHLIAIHNVAHERNGKLFECTGCKEMFPCKSDGMTHSYIHHGDDPTCIVSVNVSKLFVCEFCDKCYRQSVELIDHRAAHSPPRPYLCKFCNQDFDCYLDLQSHLNAHEEDGVRDYKDKFSVPVMFLCEYCEACFISYHSFRQHCKTHDGRYKCLFCPQSFTSYNALNLHRATHSRDVEVRAPTTPYACQVCGKAFMCCSALTKHARTHSNEKPFQCPNLQCRKKFSQSSGLYTHMKVHSDIRPYKCDICEKAFKIIGDYKLHVRRHSGERPYVCSVCNKAFLTRKTYVQHKGAHDGVRSFKCPTCHVTFRRSHTLKTHLERHRIADKLKNVE